MNRTKPKDAPKNRKKLRNRSRRKKRLAVSTALMDGLRVEPLPKR